MRLSFFKKSLLLCAILLTASISLFADTTYKVEKGDTLYSISRKYQLTVAELRAANNLSENDVIKVGQKLKIPSADISAAAALATDNKATTDTTTTVTTTATKEYTVVKGDTMYSISKKNGMTLAEFMALNNLDNSSVIKVGQKLKIADTSAAKTTTSTTSTTTNTTISTGPSTSSGTTGTTTTTTTTAPDTRTYGTTVAADKNTVWPVKNPTVTQVKGKVGGVQLSAQVNEPVVCIREGTVMYVGVYRGFGQVIFVQSKTGVIYTYTGLGSVSVKKGDYVVYNQQLGTAGIDAISGKPGITFMVFQNGQPIDPAKAPRN
ncbi:MAG: LysM peptidoglycan-binding domain-containing protein [Treponema sp.]|nr:LysM peptidoglycan-binding domain-containing protein [Treponema sp.]